MLEELSGLRFSSFIVSAVVEFGDALCFPQICGDKSADHRRFVSLGVVSAIPTTRSQAKSAHPQILNRSDDLKALSTSSSGVVG